MKLWESMGWLETLVLTLKLPRQIADLPYTYYIKLFSTELIASSSAFPWDSRYAK